MPACSSCGVVKTRFPQNETRCTTCRDSGDIGNSDGDAISNTIVAELTQSLGDTETPIGDLLNSPLPNLSVVQFIKIITVIIKPLKEDSAKTLPAEIYEVGPA